jgi:hypothetical protein
MWLLINGNTKDDDSAAAKAFTGVIEGLASVDARVFGEDLCDVQFV